jgi:hypothetical protein
MAIGETTVPVALEAEVWIRIKGASTLHHVGTMTPENVDLNSPSEFLKALREGIDEVAAAVQPILTHEVKVNVG